MFESKDVLLDKEVVDHEVKLLLWDTSGNDDQKENICDMLAEKNGVIVMFDANKAETYETAQQWVSKVKEKLGDVAILLVSNKTDVDASKRAV